MNEATETMYSRDIEETKDGIRVLSGVLITRPPRTCRAQCMREHPGDEPVWTGPSRTTSRSAQADLTRHERTHA